MKTSIFSLAAVALLALLAPPAHAQNYSSLYGFGNLSLSGIGTTAAATTTTVTNQVLDVRGFQNVTLLTKVNFSGATTSNVVYSISKSLDRVNFESTPSVTWTVTPTALTSTNNCVATTTIATGGAGYLRLESIQNTHGSLVLTNLLFEYSIKRQAP